MSFPVNFEHFQKRMQEERPRGSGNDHFGYGSKPNIETPKNDEDDDLSDFDYESIFEAGVPQGSSQSIPGVIK